MEPDTDKYVEMTNFFPGVYYNVPVLARISPTYFVAAVLKLEVNRQVKVLDAFRSRYDHQLLNNELREEKKWLIEVKALLEQKASQLPTLSKWRITTLIKNAIDPWLMSDASLGSNGSPNSPP